MWYENKHDLYVCRLLRRSCRYCPCCYASGTEPRFIASSATHMLHDRTLSPFSSSRKETVFAEWWVSDIQRYHWLLWAKDVCARVCACELVLGRVCVCTCERMCWTEDVCVCVCVHVDLCWTEDHIHVKGAGNRHFVLRCVNFWQLLNGVSGEKEKEESTISISAQGWDPHV